jgi:hypothetical protein
MKILQSRTCVNDQDNMIFKTHKTRKEWAEWVDREYPDMRREFHCEGTCFEQVGTGYYYSELRQVEE